MLLIFSNYFLIINYSHFHKAIMNSFFLLNHPSTSSLCLLSPEIMLFYLTYVRLHKVIIISTYSQLNMCSFLPLWRKRKETQTRGEESNEKQQHFLYASHRIYPSVINKHWAKPLKQILTETQRERWLQPNQATRLCHMIIREVKLEEDYGY